MPTCRGIATTNTRLHTGPGADAPVIRRVPQGAQLDVLSCVNRWCLADWRGTQGYISQNLMDFPEGSEAVDQGMSDGDTTVIVPRTTSSRNMLCPTMMTRLIPTGLMMAGAFSSLPGFTVGTIITTGIIITIGVTAGLVRSHRRSAAGRTTARSAAGRATTGHRREDHRQVHRREDHRPVHPRGAAAWATAREGLIRMHRFSASSGGGKFVANYV